MCNRYSVTLFATKASHTQHTIVVLICAIVHMLTDKGILLFTWIKNPGSEDQNYVTICFIIHIRD
jgi:hypothetical protein